MAAIYKIWKKGYLLHADRKAVSGFKLAWDPFIYISEGDYNANVMVNAIKEVIKQSENEERVPNPKNWAENSKQFLKKTGLKTMKELDADSTKYCGIDGSNDSIIFTPTKHAELPDRGFVNKFKTETNIIDSSSASDYEIFEAFEFALIKSE